MEEGAVFESRGGHIGPALKEHVAFSIIYRGRMEEGAVFESRGGTLDPH